jgi:Sec-independent protein secretion pathway component TatC
MPYRWPDLSVDDGKVNGSARRLVLATAFVIGALVTPPHADAAFPGK